MTASHTLQLQAFAQAGEDVRRLFEAQNATEGSWGWFQALADTTLRGETASLAVLRTDGQNSQIERATFSDWQIAGCPHHGPGLAIGSDGIRHAVWYEAKGKPTIRYGQLDPGHVSQRQLAIATAGASHADVTVHERTVWVIWNQVDAHGYRLMLRRSTDNGAHFDAPREIARNNGAVASPQLLQKQGRAFVAWNTAAGFRLIGIPR